MRDKDIEVNRRVKTKHDIHTKEHGVLPQGSKLRVKSSLEEARSGKYFEAETDDGQHHELFPSQVDPD